MGCGAAAASPVMSPKKTATNEPRILIDMQTPFLLCRAATIANAPGIGVRLSSDAQTNGPDPAVSPYDTNPGGIAGRASLADARAACSD
jgi:hypothetical protein